MKRYSVVLRLQYFETGGFNSRIYAYENDVLYSYSIPANFDKGSRYYMVLNYDICKKFSLCLRWAETVSRGNIISGVMAPLNKITELKIQLHFSW
jgi:hypothetical protein